MAGIGVIATTIPAPLFNTPAGNPVLPASADLFTPPVTAGLPGSYSSIASYQRWAPPGRGMLVMGDNFSGTPRLATWGQSSGANKRLSFGTTLRLAGNNIKTSIDAAQPATAFLMSMYDHGFYGPSVMVNIAEIWWLASSSIGGDAIPLGATDAGSATGFAGDTISIHGRNLVKPIQSTTSATIVFAGQQAVFQVGTGLSFTSGNVAHVRVNGSNGANSMDGTIVYNPLSGLLTLTVTRSIGAGTYSDWSIYGADYALIWESTTASYVPASRVTDISPYRIQFTAPAWTNGTYFLAVHNTMGGVYGWSESLKLTITDAATYDPCSLGAGSFNFAANTFALTTASPVNGQPNNPALDFAKAVNDVASYMASNGMKAATVQLAGTPAAPATYYMTSTAAALLCVKWVGGGEAYTKIQTASTFADNTVFGATGTSSSYSFFANLSIDVSTGGNLANAGFGPDVITAGGWLRCDNVAIFAPNVIVQNIHVGQPSHFRANNYKGVILNNCTLLGLGIAFAGSRQSLLADGCLFLMAQIVAPPGVNRGAPINPYSCEGVSITNCTIQDYNPAGGDSQIGCGRILNDGGGNPLGCLYAANNKLNNAQAPTWDQNNGEIFNFDGGSLPAAVGATGGTANTIIIAGGVVGNKVWLTSGKGAGQWRVITAVNGNVCTVHKNWLVIPDATTSAYIYPGPIRAAIYNNTLANAATGTVPASSTIFEAFSYPSGDIVIDGNTTTRLVRFLALFGDHFGLFTDRNLIVDCRGQAVWTANSHTHNAVYRDTKLDNPNINALAAIAGTATDFDLYDGGYFKGGLTGIDFLYISGSATGNVDLLNVILDGVNVPGSHQMNPTGGGSASVQLLGASAFIHYASP